MKTTFQTLILALCILSVNRMQSQDLTKDKWEDNGNDIITNSAFTGNIGIGIATPSAKLHIEGVALPNTTGVPTLLAKASNSAAARFIPDGTGNPMVEISDPCGQPGMVIRKNTGRGDIRFTGSSLEFTASGTSTSCSSVATNGMELNANGQLKIGNVPAVNGYRLFVKDGILTEGLKIAMSNDPSEWADYVFEKDYELMPLEQVKHYIETQKHLPNMPSTCDLQANGGIDMKKMVVKQQEKIEELYLYILQLKAEVEKLKAVEN